MSETDDAARFSHLFHLIGDPVVEFELVDGTPIVRTVNTAFVDVFGYGREEILGESLNEFIVPTESSEEASRFDQRTADGKYNSGVVTRLTATGPREFLYRGVPYERDGGKYGFAIYTDVTERNRRKEELQRQKERLEEFTSVLSHDLRNPLNVAQLRVENLDTEQAAVIERNLNRIESIIEDVLALAWGGQTVEETEPVSLSGAVGRCWEQVETGGATVSVAEDGRFQAEPSRLQQLFENLLRNCVEHGDDDVHVTVGLLGDRDGFYVADDGPGIAPADRDAVFERGYSTTTDGTGLGLSIVRGVCDAHGWECTVTESAEGGARFEVRGVETDAGRV